MRARAATDDDHSAKAVTTGPKHHFFGYYEKCPWDPTGRHLLGLETSFMDRPPLPSDAASVGIIDLEHGNTWRAVGETRAWNWQQGCMLQWVGASTDDPWIIYNDLQDGRLVALVNQIRTGKTRVLPRPVYSVSRDGRWGLSLNFARLQRVRPGYGYCGVEDPWREVAAPKDDGIYLMDLTTGESALVLSIAEIVRFGNNPNMEGSEHWFNHLQFSPDGRRFAFLHRWRNVHSERSPDLSVIEGQRSAYTVTRRRAWRLARKGISVLKATPIGGWIQRLQDRFWHPRQPFQTRMFTAGLHGSGVYCLAADGFVSHYDWRNNHQVLAWATQEGVGDRFFLFTDETDQREVVGEGVLTNDGHCTFSPDGRWILTDSGPNAQDISTLILYCLESGRRYDVIRVYSPPELLGEIRCDLHPRWDRSGRQVCFDSAHEGERQIYLLDVTRWVG